MAITIDLKFLEEQEGFSNIGYVPNGKKSGVTIGTGVDLGQQSEKKLRDAGLSPDYIRTLKPYIGLQGDEARKKLEKSPLAIPRDIAKEITGNVITYDLDKLVTEYNKGSSSSKFEDLSPQQQTVLLSVTHQYGLNGAPKFMGFAQKGEWDNVVGELRDFKDDYGSRRNREADYLEGKQDEPIYENRPEPGP